MIASTAQDRKKLGQAIVAAFFLGGRKKPELGKEGLYHLMKNIRKTLLGLRFRPLEQLNTLWKKKEKSGRKCRGSGGSATQYNTKSERKNMQAI